jgi:hypothetical protein
MPNTTPVVRCLYPGCKCRRSYGFPSEQPMFCLIHKVEGAVNVVQR